MRILQIVAHPDLNGNSFTNKLAAAFREGATQAGHTVTWYNLFHPDIIEVETFQEDILNTDALCLAWPCWWEMPPAKLVDYLQTVFVKDFAFELVDQHMKPKLNLPVTCLISMGQQKSLNTTNLSEAMRYCGLHPQFIIFENVGPRLSADLAETYLNVARTHGLEA